MEDKYFANRGVERNKKPLKNKVYEIKLSQLSGVKPEELEKIKEELEKYRFKDLGYLVLYWWYDTKNVCKNMHGYVTPESLKAKLGEKQWSKFCQGKRTFIIQRRVNGKNIKKNV